VSRQPFAPGDGARSRRQARRARSRRVAECCSWGTDLRYIQPGEVYLHLVLFPRNDVWDNRVPLTMSECAACARRWGRGALIDEREAKR